MPTFADPTRRCGTARKAATGCPCGPCTAYRRRRASSDKASRIRRERGQTLYVDAAPVRAHVQRLLDMGMSRHQVALLAGLGDGGRTIIRNLVVGQPHQGQGPAKRMRPETAAALLAVEPVHGQVVAGALLDATGTRRRIQALVANGWTLSALAKYLGYDSPSIQFLGRSVVSSTTAERVRSLYDRLQGLPGTSSKARAHAKRHGWLPPGWWDADTIDDPTYEPDGVRLYEEAAAVGRPRIRPAELIVDYTAPYDVQAHRLRERGFSIDEVADLLSATPRQVRRWHHRHATGCAC